MSEIRIQKTVRVAETTTKPINQKKEDVKPELQLRLLL